MFFGNDKMVQNPAGADIDATISIPTDVNVSSEAALTPMQKFDNVIWPVAGADGVAGIVNFGENQYTLTESGKVEPQVGVFEIRGNTPVIKEAYVLQNASEVTQIEQIASMEAVSENTLYGNKVEIYVGGYKDNLIKKAKAGSAFYDGYLKAISGKACVLMEYDSGAGEWVFNKQDTKYFEDYRARDFGWEVGNFTKDRWTDFSDMCDFNITIGPGVKFKKAFAKAKVEGAVFAGLEMEKTYRKVEINAKAEGVINVKGGPVDIDVSASYGGGLFDPLREYALDVEAIGKLDTGWVDVDFAAKHRTNFFNDEYPDLFDGKLNINVAGYDVVTLAPKNNENFSSLEKVDSNIIDVGGGHWGFLGIEAKILKDQVKDFVGGFVGLDPMGDDGRSPVLSELVHAKKGELLSNVSEEERRRILRGYKRGGN